MIEDDSNRKCDVKTMDVSIIIVNWNTRDILRECLRSVYEQTKDILFEVIVVDNASTDGSMTMVKQKFPQIVLIENTRNLGYAEANNQAMAISKGRYLLLLNSDTVVLENAISKAVKVADNHFRVAALGCRVLNSDGTLQSTFFMFPSVLNMLLSSTCLDKIFPKNKLFGREYLTWWNANDVREVDVVAGCFMLVRREAIQQVGVFDARYFFYGEETDWCYRFKQAGWKILYTPEMKIIHYGGRTSKQMAGKIRLQLAGSILMFMRLHKTRLEFVLACLLMSLFFVLRVPYWLVYAILHKNNRKKSIKTMVTYLIGGFYCIINWRRLLINYNTATNIVTQAIACEVRIDS